MLTHTVLKRQMKIDRNQRIEMALRGLGKMSTLYYSMAGAMPEDHTRKRVRACYAEHDKAAPAYFEPDWRKACMPAIYHTDRTGRGKSRQ